jgi:hypothetical protein
MRAVTVASVENFLYGKLKWHLENAILYAIMMKKEADYGKAYDFMEIKG